MKKFISIFIVVMSVLTIMVSAVSCSGEEMWEQLWCKHEYDTEKVVEEATCSKEGEKELTCSVCGYVDTEKIEKSAHEYENIPAKNATCRETGLTEYKKCIDCGFVEVEPKVIPVKGHAIAYNEEVIPTCIDSGLTKGRYCTDCGEIIAEQKYLSPLGHKLEVKQGKPATCTEDGLTDGVYCLRCNVVYQEQEIIPVLGHKDSNGDGLCDVCSINIYAVLLEGYNTADVIERDKVSGEKLNEPFVVRIYRNNIVETRVLISSGEDFDEIILCVSPDAPSIHFSKELDSGFISISFEGEFAYKDYGTHVDYYIGNSFSYTLVTKVNEELKSKTISISGEKSLDYVNNTGVVVKILSLSN